MTNIPVEFNRIRDGAVRQLAGNFVKLEDADHQPINSTNPFPVSLMDSAGNAIDSVDEKLRTASSPIGYEIARGNLSSKRKTTISASVLGAGATWCDMWGGAPATLEAPLLTAAIAMEAVGGAQDTAAGTGISQIRIHYIDTNRDAQVIDIQLTGAVAVAIPNNILHINKVYAIVPGAGATAPYVASGNIDIRGAGGGTVYARIPAGYNSSPRLVFRIPRTFVGYWVDILAFVVALSVNFDAQLQIVANVDILSTTVLVQGLWEIYWTVGGGSAGANTSISLAFPFKFPEDAIVKCRVRRVSGAGLADGFMTGSGWIENGS